jgi:hypothetical protein
MAGKKRYFPGRVGNIPGEVGKNREKKPGQLMGALSLKLDPLWPGYSR